MVDLARTVPELRQHVRTWRDRHETIGLVPTMGALHEGHAELVRRASQSCRHVVVSIFVNPKQFNEADDFARYPRNEERDSALLRSLGVDLIWAPQPEVMYPSNFSTTVKVSGVTEGLEAPLRPGHFDGMATVVTKLLLQCLPDEAFFGEKDYQQLLTVQRLVADLDIPTTIVPVETVRDEYGLALSSRNALLTPDQLSIARTLNRTLAATAQRLAREPDAVEAALAAAARSVLAAGFDDVEYLELRDAGSLDPLPRLDRAGRLLAAARLGKVRLLDNVPVFPA